MVRHSGGDAGQLLGRAADAVHAGVDLHVDRHRVPDATGRDGEGLDPRGRVERRREPVGQRGRRGLGPALAEQQDRRGDAVLAQLHPFVHQRHGQPPGPAGQRGPGHRRPAVAVAVGLDHRAQLGRRGEARQHRRVVGHGGQVDLGPGRARPPLRHGHRVVVVGHRGHQPDARGVGHREPSPLPPPCRRLRPAPRRARRPPGRAGRRRPGPRPGRVRPPARARGRPAPPPPARRAPGRRRRR